MLTFKEFSMNESIDPKDKKWYRSFVEFVNLVDELHDLTYDESMEQEHEEEDGKDIDVKRVTNFLDDVKYTLKDIISVSKQIGIKL